MQKDDLQPLLEAWEIDLPDDPCFRASVWREISSREKAVLPDMFRETLDDLVNSRLAIPVAIGAVLLVLATASFHGVQNREQAWRKMALAYSSTIDPIVDAEHKLAKGR